MAKARDPKRRTHRAVELAERVGDVVFGATDGTISTLAVVAGVAGAGADVFIVIIAGVSAMLAEAASMGFASGLSRYVKETILSVRRAVWPRERPLSEALTFWLATMGGGAVPIVPFALALVVPLEALSWSVALSMAFLFVVGALTARWTKKSPIRTGVQAAIVGGIAAAVTWAIGHGLSMLV